MGFENPETKETAGVLLCIFARIIIISSLHERTDQPMHNH